MVLSVVNAQIPTFPAVTPGDVKPWAIDFADILAPGEALVGSPTGAILDSTEQPSTAGGTLANVTINGTQIGFQLTVGNTYGEYFIQIQTQISGLPYPITRSARYYIQFR